jgi:hypothetical protein
MSRVYVSHQFPSSHAVSHALASRPRHGGRALDAVACLSGPSGLQVVEVKAGEAAEGVTIAITDDLFPANDGVWHVDANGAVHDEIEPAGADLATDVATLAATYLGGVRWSALADVGRVEVRNDSALAPADTLLLHSPAPFCGSAF